MNKYFNTTGFCRPELHYMVDPFRGLLPDVYTLIERQQFFAIHAPRQTGKTTFLHQLAHRINGEGKYIATVCSMEGAAYQSIGVEAANEVLIRALYLTAQLFLPSEEWPPNPYDYTARAYLLREYLGDWSIARRKPIVLLIDEIDSLYDDVLVSVLRQLRDGFQLRPQRFPQSIALVGLRDIREYKLRARGDNPSLGSGSPFNVKARSFFLSVFSKDDVQNLLQQHTDATGQEFSNEVIEAIYEFSGGQPWLCNALAAEIVSEILEDDYSQIIPVAMVETAKERLIAARQTHLDSLADKLKEERVRKIVTAIVSGDEVLADDWDDSIRYCTDLGIVKTQNGSVTFANPIYREIITRVLNSSMQGGLTGKEEYTPTLFVQADGRLDMDKLLRAFQQFYREHSEHWLERFQYKEAGHQLLLMAFLQRIVNGGGRIHREMAAGRGRTDLVIYWQNEVHVIEMKIKRNAQALEKGRTQLNRYLDTLGQRRGYLVIFELKSSAELPWEERIKWTVEEYEGKELVVLEL
jgi:hypothetical protein